MHKRGIHWDSVGGAVVWLLALILLGICVAHQAQGQT